MLGDASEILACLLQHLLRQLDLLHALDAAVGGPVVKESAQAPNVDFAHAVEVLEHVLQVLTDLVGGLQSLLDVGVGAIIVDRRHEQVLRQLSELLVRPRCDQVGLRDALVEIDVLVEDPLLLAEVHLDRVDRVGQALELSEIVLLLELSHDHLLAQVRPDLATVALVLILRRTADDDAPVLQHRLVGELFALLPVLVDLVSLLVTPQRLVKVLVALDPQLAEERAKQADLLDLVLELRGAQHFPVQLMDDGVHYGDLSEIMRASLN